LRTPGFIKSIYKSSIYLRPAAMKVKNIILDFGGVIIDVNYQRAADSFRILGANGFEKLYSKKEQAGFFDDFEKGIIRDEQFRDEVRKYMPSTVSDEQIDNAWNSMVDSIPQARMDYLIQLKNDYRLFLLSNTNNIHAHDFTLKLDRQYGPDCLFKVFERRYLSFQIGMRKPDAEIFLHVMGENKLEYSETVFIDDSMQHVEGARHAGLTAVHLDLDKTVIEKFLPEWLEQQKQSV
jgi:putative hydrolase of the HAD superfamily